MNPTGLPELSKPLRDLNFDQKREKLKFQNFEKFKKSKKSRHDYLLFSVDSRDFNTRDLQSLKWL